MARTIGRVFGWAACAASVLLLIAALALSGRADAASGPRVSGAQVRLAAVAGRPAAGYFTLHGGSADDTLVAVASPLAARAELHATTMAGGVMRMAKLSGVLLRQHGSLAFAPGGSHLMIFGLRGDLKPGATVPLVLRFRSGTTLRTDAVAVALGAEVAMPLSHGAH